MVHVRSCTSIERNNNMIKRISADDRMLTMASDFPLVLLDTLYRGKRIYTECSNGKASKIKMEDKADV